MTQPPDLKQFRIKPARDGLIHLVFDMPGRSMNVFSNAAILELESFADWLVDADVRGVVIRSGKPSAFCAGADLGELGVAYDMIMAAAPPRRFNLAFDHFFPLGRAVRRLESAGKPVAACIAGLALGGGCEFAMGAHYRVLVDDPKAALGLPESLVGLLPGSGGTQRMTRLVGVELALDVLLDGRRLAGREALDAGLVHALVAPGEEVAAAERCLLDAPGAVQPWDRADAKPARFEDYAPVVSTRRAAVLQETQGHYPAMLAVLDCVEQGFMQLIEAAIRTEMSIFASLIQRREPRNMIRTLFMAKGEVDRATRGGGVPPHVASAAAQFGELPERHGATPALAMAGFGGGAKEIAREATGAGYWFEEPDDPQAAEARRAIDLMVEDARPIGAELTDAERRMADYLVVRDGRFPAYLGGPLALVDERGAPTVRA